MVSVTVSEPDKGSSSFLEPMKMSKIQLSSKSGVGESLVFFHCVQ